ncbi:MAG: hypothetical protein HQ541_22380, partial [Mariniphaga sp.]|nr:hypothetical protein [Mariniphaga sp.]
MSQIYKEFYKKYNSLRNDIDKHCEKLSLEHSEHLQCKKGCDLCCMDYSIFPVEFFSIADELKSNGIT